MAMVMPSFDAFLSSTTISGANRQYKPRSLPTITNQALFCSLILHYSDVGVFDTVTSKWQLKSANSFTLKPAYYSGQTKLLSPSFPSVALTASQLPTVAFDFVLGNNVAFLTLASNQQMYIRLTQSGRFWYSILRGLGYTCDPFDTKPVSILPLSGYRDWETDRKSVV